MPVLNEYIKLRTEQNRELSWGELDENFLYVANPWVSYRYYKEGSIVYYDAGITGSSGLSWYRATIDNGPATSFNIGDWEPIGASSAGSGSIVVQNGLSTNTVSVLDFGSSDFNISVAGSTATITLDASAIKYWLESGDPNIGTGQNAAAVIHTGNVVIGAGSFGSYKLAVNGTTNITGDLTVGGTINTVDILTLANEYAAHTHTALPTSFANYSILFPDSISTLADFDINAGTLTNGQVISWNNSSQKWVNTTIASTSLQTLSDVNFAIGLANNQILQYDTSTSKWTNRNLTLNGSTGFTTPGMAHNHDTRYYTKTQLGSISSSFVNWYNLSNLPQDTTEYVIIGTSGSPFISNNVRVLGSSDGSINIDVATPNVIDITTTLSPGVDVEQNSTFVDTAYTLDFVDNSYGNFTLTPLTGNVLQVELDTPSIIVTTAVTGAVFTSNLNFLDPDGNAADPADSNIYFTPSLNPTSGQYDIIGVSKLWVGIQDADPSTTTTFTSISLPRLVFKDNADGTWVINEDLVNGYALAEYNPNLFTTVAVLNNGSFVDDVSTIDFVSGIGANVTTGTITGGVAEVTVDVTADLDTICSNGNTTSYPLISSSGGAYVEVSGGLNYILIDDPADTVAGTGGLILTSPNGSYWLITVDDSGNLVTTPA